VAPFSIVHVTPYPWEARTEVGCFVERATSELRERGHRVAILAPARTEALVRSSRTQLRELRANPERLWEQEVVIAGEVLDMPWGSRRALPVDVARTIEELLATVPTDFVHVHEPFAPSAPSAALRHSRSLNVGTFHAPTEHLVSTQVARRVVELFFGRLDARTVSFAATGALMARHFPAEYRLLRPGADPVTRSEPELGGVPHIVMLEREERPALRVLLRALRRLGTGLPWRCTVISERGESATTPLRAELRTRITFASPEGGAEERALADADVLVCGSEGAMPAPGLLLRALRAGIVPIASRLPVYEEILVDGELGLLFEPRDAEVLAAQLARVLGDASLRARLLARAQPRRDALTWSRVTDELEDVYESVAARRHDAPVTAALRRQLARRPLIDVDLHMHTDHSGDCATPVEVLLATARQQGLGAIAVTDHNEISGAVEAQAKAEGIKVIVGEEVKTASQGEVIGLFLTEKIPRGLSLAETVAEIRRQGGLVYVPHPFDRLHAVPDYEHLLGILQDIDAIEVYNPRVAIGAFNEEAARFAAKYRILAGAGSDSHVAQGLGSVRVRMRDFDGPEQFLASLVDAEIHTRPTSLLYVQALKFLETKATPPGARRARRERRVRRALRS
jgi:hypothetical protein